MIRPIKIDLTLTQGHMRLLINYVPPRSNQKGDIMNKPQSAISLLGYAEGQAEDLQYKIKQIKKELSQAESELVGARERILALREVVRITNSQKVVEEVFSREVQIAHMKGHEIEKGDVLTAEIRAILRG